MHDDDNNVANVTQYQCFSIPVTGHTVKPEDHSVLYRSSGYIGYAELE